MVGRVSCCYLDPRVPPRFLDGQDMVDLWVHLLEEREHHPILTLMDVVLHDG